MRVFENPIQLLSGWFEFKASKVPDTAPSGVGRLYYDQSTGTLRATLNGAAAAKIPTTPLAYTDFAARAVEAHTGDDTLTAAETGSVHTNTGASGAVVLTLPVATVGLEFFFGVGAAQQLRLDPNGTETISLPSSGVPGAAGKYLWADLAEETVHLLCVKAGNWSVMGYTGTWTHEV